MSHRSDVMNRLEQASRALRAFAASKLAREPRSKVQAVVACQCESLTSPCSPSLAHHVVLGDCILATNR